MADFLAGALLSLLFPVFLLIALTVWYLVFISKVPETGEGERRAGTASTTQGPELGHTSQRLE